MKVAERCEALARASQGFPWLGISAATDLIELVRRDLGSVAALERGVIHGKMLSRAIPPRTTLHIVSGNTPHAALQSITRGLLLGGTHWVKLPSAGLSEVEQFLSLLPVELSQTVTLSRERRADWIEQAECVVVFGSDATLSEVHAQLKPHQRFIAHGHKMGFGFIFGDWDRGTAGAAAKDVCDFDQLGCLSPVALFVEHEAARFAEHLANAMDEHESHSPRRSIAPAEAATIATLRNQTAFRSRTGEDCRLWASEGSTAWTVVYDAAPPFPSSPLNRFIVVKPMPDLGSYFPERRAHLSTAGTNAKDETRINQLIEAGFQRVCPLGKMQEPASLWHHDGYLPLASRVRWVDVELE